MGRYHSHGSSWVLDPFVLVCVLIPFDLVCGLCGIGLIWFVNFIVFKFQKDLLVSEFYSF
jgi:hypothetical protein